MTTRRTIIIFAVAEAIVLAALVGVVLSRM